MMNSEVKIKHNIRDFINDNFYIFFVILSFLSFRFSFLGSVRSVFWVLLIVLNLPSCFKKKGLIDDLIYIYIATALLSIVGWLQRDYPFSFFLTVLFESYVPIIFYFIGRESSEQISTFYKRCIYAILFVNLIGFWCIYTMPSWYVEKSLEVMNENGFYSEDNLKFARFASFLDSYHTSSLSVYMLCISIGGYYFLHNKLWARVLFMFSLIIAVIGILLAQQRVAMFVGLALIPLNMLLMSINNESKNRLATAKLSVLIVIGICFIIVLTMQFEDYFSADNVLQRFSGESRDAMVSSRSGTWVDALENQEDFIFGHGLGGGGHLAQTIGITPTVRDGSYFVLLLETGLLSVITFISILGVSLIRGFMRRRVNIIDLSILIYCCFALVGSNCIHFPYVIGVMWYAIGRINRKEDIVITDEGIS